MTTAELILYATPAGPLADALRDLYRHLEVDGRSTAQNYPPHCTLTGFFTRDEQEIPRISGELEAVLATEPAEGDEEVGVVALHRKADWVGLELRSAWLHDVTRRFVDAHAVGPNDDALRPKDWLHLSIAYGAPDLGAAISATEQFDHSLAVRWEVALWRRGVDHAWTRVS